mgnify:CR=1 FL=1
MLDQSRKPGKPNLYKDLQDVVVEGVRLVDEPVIIPLGDDGVHIFKTAADIGDRKFIVGVRHALQIVPSHHVNAKTVQQP